MKTKVSLRDFPSAKKRREFLQKKLKVKLENIAQFSFTENHVAGRNIENLIGCAQIPLGVAGPLKIINHKSQITNHYIPLATTEGALVASLSRGCKAITESRGAKVYVEDVGQTRGPVFKTQGIEHGQKVTEWINSNIPLLSQSAQKTSSRLKLLRIKTAMVGKNLFVRFSYSTSDAMGMNMVTIATQEAVKVIEQETRAKCIALAGNYDIDKKPAWLNFIEGRGKKVWAEVTIPQKTVRDVLKTNPKQIVEVVKSKAQMGSIMSGSLGFNSHFANIVAAIFAATGQDLAHVVEGSLGVTDAEVLRGNLYFSIYMPSLQVGTVGGGTSLPTQKEALQIMQVNNVLEYAKAVAAAVLAGELSLVASLAEGSLVKAHKKLGRKGINNK